MESRSRVLLLTRPLAVAAVALVGLSGCASLKWPWWGRGEAATAETGPVRVTVPAVPSNKALSFANHVDV